MIGALVTSFGIIIVAAALLERYMIWNTLNRLYNPNIENKFCVMNKVENEPREEELNTNENNSAVVDESFMKEKSGGWGSMLHFLQSPISVELFGANKRWRGLFTLPVCVTLVLCCTRFLFEGWFPLFGEPLANLIVFGLGAGFFMQVMELPNSFLKRKLLIHPGATSANNLSMVLDCCDSSLGLLAWMYWFGGVFDDPWQVIECALTFPLVYHFGSAVVKSKIWSNPVFCNVPNTIGHVRLLLLFGAVFFVPFDNYLAQALLIGLSQLLDHFDGYFARRLNQNSKFGILYDTFIDHVSHCVTFGLLAQRYPSRQMEIMASLVISTSQYVPSMLWAGLNNVSHERCSFMKDIMIAGHVIHSLVWYVWGLEVFALWFLFWAFQLLILKEQVFGLCKVLEL